MSNLPKGWVEKKIDDVAELINGDRGKNYPSQDQQLDDGYCLFLNTPNVKHGRFNFSNTKFITKEQHESLRNGTLNRNDIVLTIRGTLGNCAVYTDDVDFKTVRINSAMMIVRPSIAIHPWYLTRILSSSAFLEWSQKNHRGSAQPHLRATDIKEYPIFFPAIAEQKRIVEKLDEVLAQVDIIKARLDGIPELLKRFRQSVLASAVSGKLTEEWRGGPSSDFHQSPITVGNEDKASPSGWAWQMLTDLAKLESGHTPRKTVAEYWDDGDVYWICLQDIRAAHGKVIQDTKFKPTMLGIDNSSARLLPAGTVCFSRDISVGFTTIMGKEMSTTQHFANWICGSELSNKYLMYALMAAKRHLTDTGQGTTVKTVYMPALKQFHLLTPPLIEQKEIVRLVEQYFTFADTIEAQVKKAQARVDNLTQSILAKAFRGELVAQDPNDEPADKLLERIAEARKEAEALAKAAKKAEAAKKRAAKSV
ncbi:restriction endonuclease subunit S [Vibrio sp. HENC-03]|uniref:restriction endonuclease subunit S n=1 Tax=Vibrio sp. HENC-03 TaxID=992012 RepID=UPI00028C8ACC|nr:restriction endonuclease subunit S [Vibrio sp. HENC-03]EKM24794.1 type I restriction modification DNA specificity domain protein [Vibrio sp. HENC-03]